MFPINEVRAQFPNVRDNAVIFLDNPAGTQVPQTVVDAVAKGMITASSNLGGYFEASKAADEIWLRAHEGMADLLGAPSHREIIIGPSMTTLTLHLSRSIAKLLAPGDEIIVTRMDHEGDVAPWLHIAEDVGCQIKWLPFNRETWRIEPEDLSALLSERTRLVALNYASNLTGSINDIQALVAMAKAAGAMTFVDAVQFVPHGLADVQALDCDFLACSSYKFFGPHLGILRGREDLLERMTAYKCRCSSNELPERYETGTPQTELLAGLTAAADYLQWLGGICGGTGNRRELIGQAYQAFSAYENALTLQLIEGLQALPGVTIHGITNPNRIGERVPTVSFTHETRKTTEIAQALAAQGICVWSGHNYAYEVVKHLGLDEELGVVRIGLAHYNLEDEVARTLDALSPLLR